MSSTPSPNSVLLSALFSIFFFGLLSHSPASAESGTAATETQAAPQIDGIWVRNIESGEASLSIRPDGTYLVSYEGLGHRPDETGTVSMRDGKYWLNRSDGGSPSGYSLDSNGKLQLDSKNGKIVWAKAESPAGIERPIYVKLELPENPRSRAIALLQATSGPSLQMPKPSPLSRQMLAEAGSFRNYFEDSNGREGNESITIEKGPNGEDIIRFGNDQTIQYDKNGKLTQHSDDSEDDQVFNAMMEEEWDTAARLLNNIIQRDFRNVTAYINLAEVEYHRGNFDAQVLAASNAIGYSQKGYIVKGSSATLASPFSKKEQELTRSNAASGFRQRGIGYLFLSNPSQAVVDLTEAIRTTGSADSTTYLYRGEAFLNTGRMAEAKADLDRAIQLDPNDGINYCVRAIVYKRMGNTWLSSIDALKSNELKPEYKASCDQMLNG